MSKEFNINALVFKEDDELKTFISEEFNFIYDKKTYAVMEWGRHQIETPTYNPIGPEIMNILIHDQFEFINIKDFFEKIVNKQEKNNHLMLASPITNFNLYVNNLTGKYYNNFNYFIKYLNYYKVYVTLCFNYFDNLSLKDIIRICSINVKNILLNVNEFEIEKLLEFIKLCSSKEIFVSCKFNLNKNNFNKFLDLIEKFPKDTFSTYQFEKPRITKKQIKDLEEKIKELKTNIFVKKNDGSLFSCVVDFENELVYPTFNDIENGIKFENINSINDFWNSEKFVNVRNSLITDKYENGK